MKNGTSQHPANLDSGCGCYLYTCIRTRTKEEKRVVPGSPLFCCPETEASKDVAARNANFKSAFGTPSGKCLAAAINAVALKPCKNRAGTNWENNGMSLILEERSYVREPFLAQRVWR